MSHHRHAWRCRTAAGELPGDLYVVPAPCPRRGRPIKHDVETWRVIDDWPQRVPVTQAEIDVFEAWFGDLLDEFFGPLRAAKIPCLISSIGVVSAMSKPAPVSVVETPEFLAATK